MRIDYIFVDDSGNGFQAEEWREKHLPLLSKFFKWWIKHYFNMDTEVGKTLGLEVERMSITEANHQVYLLDTHKDADLVVVLYNSPIGGYNPAWWDIDKLIFVTWENPWGWRIFGRLWRLLPSFRYSHELMHALLFKLLTRMVKDELTADQIVNLRLLFKDRSILDKMMLDKKIDDQAWWYGVDEEALYEYYTDGLEYWGVNFVDGEARGFIGEKPSLFSSVFEFLRSAKTVFSTQKSVD